MANGRPPSKERSIGCGLTITAGWSMKARVADQQERRAPAGGKETMQTILPSEFKRGRVLLLEGAPQAIENLYTSGTAQTRHKLHVRLRNLKTGRLSDRSFTENERAPVADLEHRQVQFSFCQGDRYVFLDSRTFEELALSGEQLGERHWFLRENDEYKALFLEGGLLDIALPPQVALRVVEAAPPIRGGSDATWKPARLETGLEIMVPPFIAIGELIRVDTANRKYSGRENEPKE